MQIRGRVIEISGGDEAWQHINKLSQKYSGRDYPRRQERVKVIVQPSHVSAPRGGRGEGQSSSWS